MSKSKSGKQKNILIWLILLLFSCSLVLNIYLLGTITQGSRVVRVFDGDSFELSDGRRVRLLGVDAPEVDRCLGQESKAMLEQLILDKNVRLYNVLIDDYGRNVAIVAVVDKASFLASFLRNILYSSKLTSRNPTQEVVNWKMVRSGLAKNLSVASSYEESMDEAGVFAKSQMLGVYSAACRDASHTPGCDIKGNIRNKIQSYYVPSCTAYSQVIVDESYGDVWFCTEEEAQAAGFYRSATCMY